MMRVLVLLIALLSMPALAVDAELLAQAAPSGQTQGGQQQGGRQQGGGQQQGGQQSGPTVERHPGDYCTRHCRHNEIPCGNTCLSSSSGAKCTAKVTKTCPGKP